MKQTSARELPIDRIECRPQVREHFAQEELDGLATSLGNVGLQQPILVRAAGEGWVVVDGERRLRAAKQLRWKTISAIVHEGELSDADVIQRQLIANVQRADLRPVEKARAIDRLMREAGWSATQVAAKLGLSAATVSKLLALLVLPADAQQRVDAGELAASTAYEVAKICDAGERAALLQESSTGRLTRDRVVAGRGARGGTRRRQSLPARARSRSRRVTLAVGEIGALSVAADQVELGSVVTWIEGVLRRLRACAADGIGVREAAKALAGASETPQVSGSRDAS
jgi:ParB family chromosome partitioning protein